MDNNEILTLILSELKDLKQGQDELKQDVSRLEKKMDDGFALSKNQTTAIIQAINVTNDSVVKVDKKVDTLQKQTDINSVDIVKIRAAI